jgi:hypothetical protein
MYFCQFIKIIFLLPVEEGFIVSLFIWKQETSSTEF